MSGVSSVGAHVHTPWPALSAAWCVQCSTLLDWRILWLDSQQKEVA